MARFVWPIASQVATSIADLYPGRLLISSARACGAIAAMSGALRSAIVNLRRSTWVLAGIALRSGVWPTGGNTSPRVALPGAMTASASKSRFGCTATPPRWRRDRSPTQTRASGAGTGGTSPAYTRGSYRRNKGCQALAWRLYGSPCAADEQ